MAMRGSNLAITALALLASALAGLGDAVAAPQPAKAPRSWELAFDFHDLQRIEVVLPGDRQPTAFWYLLYTVTNQSGQDVDFFPGFELVTDTLQAVVAGDRVSPTVYDVITARYKKSYPFLREPPRISGKLLQGPDNARTSVAVFPEFDPQASSVRVYIGGLSGEVTMLPNPVFDPGQAESATNQRFFTLRKSLEIAYDLPGDPHTRAMATPIRRSQAWVMR